MAGTDSAALLKRLGWETAREDVREQPPNPLVVLDREVARHRSCEMLVNGTGACGERVSYRDEYRETNLCTLHARALADLPDSVEVMRASREMTAISLANMTGEAVVTVRDIMSDTENVPAAVRLKAAEMVLDRTGFVKGQEVTLRAKEDGPHVATAADVIAERLNRLAASAENVIALPVEPVEPVED